VVAHTAANGRRRTQQGSSLMENWATNVYAQMAQISIEPTWARY
jgi:ribosomal protein S19E (S16A)